MALLLPGLLLRALIPVGFMPMFGQHGHVELALCEDYAPVPSVAMDMSTDMPMDMPVDMPMSGTPSHHAHGHCPYGTSPTLAALAGSFAVPALVQPPAPALLASPQVAHFRITPRAQSPRGPPFPV